MYWNIIDTDRYKLLKNITEVVTIPEFYMIGGTALSLQMVLSYFEDAEQEILPKTFVEYDWEEIKKFFINYQKDFKDYIEKIVL